MPGSSINGSWTSATYLHSARTMFRKDVLARQLNLETKSLNMYASRRKRASPSTFGSARPCNALTRLAHMGQQSTALVPCRCANCHSYANTHCRVPLIRQYTHAYVYVQAATHMPVRTCKPPFTCLYAHANCNSDARTHMQTSTHMPVRTCKLPLRCPYTHANCHSNAHAHMQASTHMPIHTPGPVNLCTS